jgi:hypothetical protein
MKKTEYETFYVVNLDEFCNNKTKEDLEKEKLLKDYEKFFIHKFKAFDYLLKDLKEEKENEGPPPLPNLNNLPPPPKINIKTSTV